ncbi:MAG TPA: diaminopimelate decarboxylase, partial [Bacillota bacterium]|nr:diaminopimelate decarboxylase [Bacillota bacterium]
TGALCEDRDRFATDRLLPQITAGDLLVFHDAGAYGYSHGNNFNGRLRPAELLLHGNGDVSLIRRHETPDDYFSTMIF